MNRRGPANEAGGSGYSAAFTHPDPLDPNDRARQKTQSRSDSYPYDRPVSYGQPIGTDLGGAAYQRAPDQTPPKPRNKRASDVMPYGEYGVAWEQLESLLDPYSPGDQADDALALGYGTHGRVGEDDGDIDLVGLRDLLMSLAPAPRKSLDPRARGGLLSILIPQAEIVPPDDAACDDLNTDWGEHVYAPGAEDDPV